MGIRQIIADDLTGEELPEDTAPVDVRVDGFDYKVYLSAESKETFLAFLQGLAPFLANTKPATATRSRRSSASANPDKERNTKVRTWAQNTAFKYAGADGKDRTLGDRGAIPQAVYDGYDAAVKAGTV